MSALSAILASGCAIKRDVYDVPAAPLPLQYKNAHVLNDLDGNAAINKANQAAPDRRIDTLLNEWWRFFENEELNHLVDQAMANNADLRIAMLRIAQFQARSEQAFAGQFPELSGVGQAHHDSPSNGVNSFSGFGNKIDRQYAQIGPRADWRVDIWGELKSLAEAAEMEAWAATYQRDDIRRQLLANVVSQYIEYLSLNDRLRVAQETKTALDHLLQAVSERLKAGDATIIELEQQRAAVLSVEATIPGLELQRETVANALAQLLGVTPGGLNLSARGVDSLKFPSVMPVVPSNLLLRRPDVRAIEAKLLAADADIDVARARVLPPLDLTAQAGWGVLALGSMVTPYGALYNVAANLSATIFDYGKRMQEVSYARAMHEELVETYIRVIYAAVRETEDALVNTHMNGKRLEAQQLATEAALQAWKSSQDSYDFGDIDFLTLLDTERTYHRNLDEYHRVRMERYRGLVGMFAALGGGVSPGDVLPGDGKRPAVESSANLASATLPASGIVWDEPADDQEFWLVHLAGLQDSAGIGHVWRDMRQRFPELMADRVLMPREEGRIEKNDQERTRWYRVFIARFASRNDAEDFCKALNGQLLRCNAVSSESDEFSSLLAEKPREPSLPPPSPSKALVADDAQVAAPADNSGTMPAKAVAGYVEATQNTDDSYRQAYAVQICTLFNRADAEQELTTKQALGLDVYIYPIAASDGTTLFTVRSGIFKDRQAASSRAMELRNTLHIAPVNSIPVPIRIDKSGAPAPVITDSLS